jgi:hypothetical protein
MRFARVELCALGQRPRGWFPELWAYGAFASLCVVLGGGGPAAPTTRLCFTGRCPEVPRLEGRNQSDFVQSEFALIELGRELHPRGDLPVLHWQL